ncbi:MAG: DNA polymerase III subunit gamma/tau [Candidatus Omnitrophica bacterium]|nr:DNA polymerase III subunit gamma/tau [Candidatus Omnitrophota bacterium]
MSYQILARKYRPQKFEDVVGQESVTKTLQNAVHSGRVASAYLFCGPRGVGKTSVARILAKTINCAKPAEKSPCGECVSCMEVTAGNSIDVLEIDGASNNGVDEIRTLRENVKFSPSQGKFKVYIIDEVHMLSPGAFNALLKTLEEPPTHVKFIFATTEPHKVLPTIISRCQRFDFRRLGPKVIFDRIEQIANIEKIDIDKHASLLISGAADGSLRDALVILDQMVSFSDKKISSEDVIELLGMVQKKVIFALADAIIKNKPKEIIEQLDTLISGGKAPSQIATHLVKHFRDIMVLKSTNNVPTLDMSFTPEEMEELKSQCAPLSLEEVLYILQNISNCASLMKNTMFARAPLEVMLIKLAKRANVLSLGKVLDELNRLSEDVSNETNDEPARTFASVERTPVTPVNVAPRAAPAPTIEPVIPAAGSEKLAGAVETPPSETASRASEVSTEKFNWNAVVNYVKKKKMSVFTFLHKASPVEFSDKKLVIGFGKDLTFNKEVLETETNRKIIEEAANKVTGCAPRVEFILLEFLGAAEEESAEVSRKKNETREKMKPVIEKAMDVFGGHLVRDFTEGES